MNVLLLKLFISAVPATILGWSVWHNITILTDNMNERLRHKNIALNNILKAIKKELLRSIGDDVNEVDAKELIDKMEKIIVFHNNPESWVVC